MNFLYKIIAAIIFTMFLNSCSSISDKFDFANIIDSTENWLFGDEEENDKNTEENNLESVDELDNTEGLEETEEVFPDIADIPEERPDFDEIDEKFFKDEKNDISQTADSNESELEVAELKNENAKDKNEKNNILAVMSIRDNVRFKLVKLFRDSDPLVNETAPFITENILDKKATKVAIIQFPNNSIIPDNDAKNVIEEIIKSYSSKTIKLVGHASKLGGSGVSGKRKNMEISIARAETIKNMLINIGFPAEKIYTSGKGDIEPLKNEAEKYGEAVNRRVEVFFISE